MKCTNEQQKKCLHLQMAVKLLDPRHQTFLQRTSTANQTYCRVISIPEYVTYDRHYKYSDSPTFQTVFEDISLHRLSHISDLLFTYVWCGRRRNTLIGHRLPYVAYRAM